MTAKFRWADAERRIGALEQAVGIGDPHAGMVAPTASGSNGGLLEAVTLAALPVILLLVAHYFLIIVFSHLSPLYLLAASVLLPLPFGFLVSARGQQRLPLWLALAFCLALAATLGMSAVTAIVDGTALLPQNRRDWIELAEYTSSIGLSYASGILLGRIFWRRMTLHEETARRAGWPYRIARKLVGQRYTPDQAHRAAASLLGLMRMVMALATIVGSVYSGWQKFAG